MQTWIVLFINRHADQHIHVLMIIWTLIIYQKKFAHSIKYLGITVQLNCVMDIKFDQFRSTESGISHWIYMYMYGYQIEWHVVTNIVHIQQKVSISTRGYM